MSAAVTHVDADVLAEFRAGLITGRRGARIAAHLAGCDRCTAVDDRLGGVSTLLASVPAPAMPDRVAQRLDTVLAAEVARRDDAERAGREHSPEPAMSPARAAHRGFRLLSLRVLAPVAAAAAVLAGGGYGLSLIAQGPGNQIAASSAGGAASRAASAAEPIAGANQSANRAAVPSVSPVSGGSHRVSLATFPVAVINTNFRAAGLEQQVENAVKAARAAGAGQQASPQLRACVEKVAGSAFPVQVLLAHYEGHPATIIVARTAQGYEAWVAGPDCSGTNRDVLNHTSLPSGI